MIHPQAFDKYAFTGRFEREFRRNKGTSTYSDVEAILGLLGIELLKQPVTLLTKIGQVEIYCFPVSETHKISFHVVEDLQPLRSGHEGHPIAKKIMVLRRLGKNADVDAKP